jgi:phosphatidylglycerophosphate synthase
MAPTSSQRPLTASDVLLFYPNLIGHSFFVSFSLIFLFLWYNVGYARIAFMIGSFYFALTNWKLTLVFYLLAFGGDAVDGHVARAFKQSKIHATIIT